MPAPKDPVVEFIRWAATAPAHEVTLALRIIKALLLFNFNEMLCRAGPGRSKMYIMRQKVRVRLPALFLRSSKENPFKSRYIRWCEPVSPEGAAGSGRIIAQ